MAKRINAIPSALLLLFLLAAGRQEARGVAVTFTVDVRYTRLASGDRVVLRADLLGRRGEDVTLQAQPGAARYAATLRWPPAFAGRRILYKFAIVRAGGATVEEKGASRYLVVPLEDRVLDAVFFDDGDTPGLQHPQDVRFTLHLRGLRFDGEAPAGVALLGGREPLTWALEQGIPLAPRADDPDAWEGTVRFDAGTRPDVPFKVAYLVDGRWMWEAMPGHINHLALLNEADTTAHLALYHDEDSMQVVPSARSDGWVDRYGLILSRLGSRAARSDYPYAVAVQLAQQGRLVEAGEAHDAFRQRFPEGDWVVDDFHALVARRTARTAGVEAAVAYLQQRAADEPFEPGRALLAYLEGELLLNAGRLPEARLRLERALQRHPRQAPFAGFSRFALAQAFLADADSSVHGQAVPHLLALDDTGAEEGLRRMALERLGELSLARGNPRAAVDFFDRLDRLCTQQERQKLARRKLWRLLKHVRDPQLLLAQVDAVLSRGLPAQHSAEVLFLKGRVLVLAGHLEEARQVFYTVVRGHPGSSFARMARAQLQTLPAPRHP